MSGKPLGLLFCQRDGAQIILTTVEAEGLACVNYIAIHLLPYHDTGQPQSYSTPGEPTRG